MEPQSSISKTLWGQLTPGQTPDTLKFSGSGSRAWGFKRVRLDHIMRMCAKNRLRVTVGAPYIFAERVPEAVGPPKMEREESEDAMEAVHDDAFPAHALPGGVAAAVPRVDAIVASRITKKIGKEKYDRSLPIFSALSYVPRTKISYLPSIPHGDGKRWCLTMRINNTPIPHDNLVAINRARFCHSCTITFSGTTTILKIVMK